MPLYSDKVLDHFANPRNAGVLPDADSVGLASNPQCGDTIKLYIKVQHGVIVDARWQTFGCAPAIAASSAASELIKGKPVGEATKLGSRAIADALGGLPPAKVHCSVLAADALKEAIRAYQSRQASDPTPGAAAT